MPIIKGMTLGLRLCSKAPPFRPALMPVRPGWSNYTSHVSGQVEDKDVLKYYKTRPL
jgi:hypothetical protein